ncbi:hypothetical protein ACFE04_019164 [Oxalis oulophora]
MMLGERHRPNPTVHVPPWSLIDDPTADIYSPFSPDGNSTNDNNNPYYIHEALAAFQRYLPSNEPDLDESDPDLLSDSAAVDAYSCDHFRMFEFKIRRCTRGRSHDWTECPYAHPGEKARRRDPRKFHYSGTACPDFRKGVCGKGDSCEFAHGVFECWLHPARYRTQPCKDGPGCRRRVCFFAHTTEQLRILPPQQSPSSVDSYDGSPARYRTQPFTISPPLSPEADSPPMSPMTCRSLGSHSINEMVASLRNLQMSHVNNNNSCLSSSPGGYGSSSSGYGSPLRPGFSSLPTTPTWTTTRPRRYSELWDTVCEEEPAMERVESGRNLRAKMFEKLSKENSMGRVDPGVYPAANTPDVDWVSDLVN